MDSGELTEAEADRHNGYFRKGWDLIEGLVILDGKPFGALTWFGKRRLRRAIRYFQAALQIHPTGWQSMCALGKIHQRLGEHQKALEWFVRAQEIDPDQSFLALEAGHEALEVRDPQHAIKLFEAAVRQNPDDSRFVSSLALAQLLAGSVAAAEISIAEALAIDPTDKIAQGILRAIERVWIEGEPIPKSIADVRRLAEW